MFIYRKNVYFLRGGGVILYAHSRYFEDDTFGINTILND